MKTAVGAFALCVYVHRHRCALSIRLDRVHPVLLYMQVWRRFLLLLILVAKGFPRTSIGKGNASDRFLRFSFYYSHYKHEQSSLLKESVEHIYRAKRHRYGKENRFASFAPADK